MDDVLTPLTYASLQYLLPQRDRHAHKGSFGHVLVIGGDEGFGGAGLMAAEAAARTGAGLVTLATHPSHRDACLSRRPELMCRAVHDASQLDSLIQKASVLVLGPGLGQSEWSRRLFEQCLKAQDKPILLDADALNLMSEGLCAARFSDLNKLVITPHAGEASRLLKSTTETIMADRKQAARDLQAHCRGVAVLKGAGTLVCHEDEGNLHLGCCEHGNPGMASGGMGDVLSGIIGGLMAQHLSPADAARLGVCIHALSADKMALEHGERGMLATDLMPWIRRLVNPAI